MVWKNSEKRENEPVWTKLYRVRCCTQTQLEGRICSLPFTDMCIHSNGIVGACCSDWKFATQYGDVKEESLYDIWNGRRHGEFLCSLLEQRPIPFCASCMRKPVDTIKHPAVLADRIRKTMG